MNDFWTYVDRRGECWLWTYRLDEDGYGWYGHTRAHRVAYRQAYGPVPSGLEVDHLCRVRRCVRPDHLEAVTHAENVRRSAPALASTCKHGHPFDEANTYRRPTGQRQCRTCNRDAVRRYNEHAA